MVVRQKTVHEVMTVTCEAGVSVKMETCHLRLVDHLRYFIVVDVANVLENFLHPFLVVTTFLVG
jgi:hypothetical protein